MYIHYPYNAAVFLGLPHLVLKVVEVVIYRRRPWPDIDQYHDFDLDPDVWPVLAVVEGRTGHHLHNTTDHDLDPDLTMNLMSDLY